MLLATALVSCAVTLGALAGRAVPAAVAASTLWAFGAGLMVVLGLQAGNLGVTTLVSLVVFAARRLTPLQAAESGLIAAACGLLQTLLAVAFWPVNRYEPERRIIGSLYGALADLCVSSTGEGNAPPATAQLAETQKALTSLSQDRSRQAERYTFLINQAERMRLSLLTLRRLMHRIARDERGAEAAAAIEHVLAAASRTLTETSRAVVDERPIDLDPFLEAAHRFRAFTQPGMPPVLDTVIRDASHQLDALAGQLRATRALVSASGAAAKPSPQTLPDNPTSIPALIRANLSFRSTAFRHALRLAICVGLAEALGRFFSLERTYWLTITIAIVLRPDYTSTFTRGILRIAGTLTGLMLATALFHFLHPGTTTEIVLSVAFAFLLRWIGPANYGVFVTAVSGYVVLLLAISGVSPRAAIVARAVNTIVGGAIALAVYRLWPTWERTRAGPVLADLVDAYRQYFRSVTDAYVKGADNEAQRNRARMKSRLARSNAEALIDRVSGEPGVTVERSNLLSVILSSAHNFVRAVMSLESGLNLRRHEHVRPATITFASQVDATLDSLAAAFRSSRPALHLPDLREAHNAILASTTTDSAQYSLVNTETDRITTSINTLADQAEKWLRSQSA
jgi:uncharacterized membrane protein YccC